MGHPRPNRLIDGWVADDTLRALARRWIAQHQTRSGCGIALGSPISPLFANLDLDQLDRTLACAGYAPVRYADDFVIACRNEYEAAAALRLGGPAPCAKPRTTRRVETEPSTPAHNV